MQLTEHFKLAEFTRSATAEANGIKNDLDCDDDRNVIENLKNLCVRVLEPLRDFADAPVPATRPAHDVRSCIARKKTEKTRRNTSASLVLNV